MLCINIIKQQSADLSKEWNRSLTDVVHSSANNSVHDVTQPRPATSGSRVPSRNCSRATFSRASIGKASDTENEDDDANSVLITGLRDDDDDRVVKGEFKGFQRKKKQRSKREKSAHLVEINSRLTDGVRDVTSCRIETSVPNPPTSLEEDYDTDLEVDGKPTKYIF